ncbi:MAG: HAMP domain-containing sensor histidine kinase [Propioniciclava sp.]|uniref:sensor histidine kinase n=1 Tax=Propioniciclava sp. TaxID=2038686 RepID=UPI0039E26E40
MTTDGTRGRRIRRRRTLTTRARVLAWFSGVMATALLGTLLITAEILLSSARAEVEGELTHEIAKFRTFTERAVEPATGAPYSAPGPLIEAYLAGVTPNDGELLFSVVDGRPGVRTHGQTALRLDRDQEVVRRAASTTVPVSGEVQSEMGAVAYAIVPVLTADGRPGSSLVLVEHAQRGIDQAWWTVRILGLTFAGALLLAAAASWFIAGRLLAPLRQVRETAEEIHSGDLSRRIPVRSGAPHDDVALLAGTFNRMLGRLQRAFDTQREWLDDAAHELRTPLTVIRGHLELPSAERTEEDRLLMLEEVDRMNRLVDDLLLLARAEKPDFLTFERVDLTDLVIGVVAKAQLLGDRRWDVPFAVDGDVTADGQRLTQALMQLVANAVDSTAAGDAVHVWSRVDGDALQLIVEDSGPGIAPEHRERVFERFHHGGVASTSTGLGLSIVRSIVQAHGGGIAIEDSALGGAAFVISLPLTTLDPTFAHSSPEEDAA